MNYNSKYEWRVKIRHNRNTFLKTLNCYQDHVIAVGVPGMPGSPLTPFSA